jgi:membrane associated rhomboid family serine protease
MTTFLIVFLVMSAFALVPMLARSWRMFFILATATGLFAGFFWLQAFTADWDKNRMKVAFAAMVAATGWIVGVSGAILRLVGRRRG